MKRRKALQTTGILCLGSTLAGCITGAVTEGDASEQNDSSTSENKSKQTGPTMQKVVVVNGASETKRIGIEVVQNHGNRVHTGYHELQSSKKFTLSREWPPRPGEFAVVLHVPDDDRYELVTFSTLDDQHDWTRDVQVVYEIEDDSEIHHQVTELPAES